MFYARPAGAFPLAGLTVDNDPNYKGLVNFTTYTDGSPVPRQFIVKPYMDYTFQGYVIGAETLPALSVGWYIYQNYDARDFRKEKIKNKLKLQEELGLEKNAGTMMIGIVSRLTDQKGFDLIERVMDELCQDNVQIVILGTGEERYENMFRHFDWKLCFLQLW